ncbi:MAG: response regulator [Deltaproteobacteria bacterium]|nr:response regulator [Deltaproteobacteria bacterium]
MRAYVADDSFTCKKLLTASLRALGLEVEAFDDGAALWEAFSNDPVQLVVTDWVMPAMTGVELCRRIRAEHTDAYTHVMIVTSLSPAEHTIEAYRAGADDFVGKPIVPELFSLQIGAATRAILGHASAGARRTLELCQSALGPQHPALIDALDDLKDLSREQRAFVRCRAFLRRQLDIATNAYGAQHPRVRELKLELEEMGAYRESA